MSSKSKRDKTPVAQANKAPASAAVQQQAVGVSYLRKGPLPAPEELEGYRRILPDAPERIFRLTETEADHRRELERRKVELTAIQVRRGQIFGLIFGVAALVVVGIAVVYNYPWVAGILCSGTILGVVTAFVLGRRETVAKKVQ